MKTCILGLVFFGLANLIQSQNDLAAVSVDLLHYDRPASVAKIAKNVAYVNSVNMMVDSKRVKKFQTLVANYDVLTSDVYTDNDPSTYTVIFKEGTNTIKALYDQNSTIISCEESFENIRLPYAIGAKLSKKHPGWEFNEVSCTVNYTQNTLTDIVYKVALKKGNKKKTVTINTQTVSL